MEKVYVWYSGATDVTGKNLVEGLIAKLDSDAFEVSGGISAPRSADIIICYGTKTQSDVEFASNTRVLNHPNNIRVNRNKLTALDKMLLADDVSVPYFSKLPGGQNDREITYPAIVRTNYHQGGQGLAICTSPGQVTDLITNLDNVGFGYIQELISFKKEYRIHVFNNKVIRCAVKVPTADPAASWRAIYKEKAERAAARNNVELNSDTMDILLKAVVKDLTLPDLIVKSNKKGWGFSRIAVNNVDRNLIDMAKKAVIAIGLDFGAVDCALDYDEEAWVIEVNTGPGLQGGTLTSYINALETYIKPSASHRGTGVASNSDAGIREEMANLMNAMTEMTSGMAAKISELSQRLNRR
jgi:glutathione synthase/RimK-type ligase-like ATP-grasp enzyme